eukprot:COSAG02_NODE_6200_length_3733_cov_3.467125_2_plen_95_part_00
MSRCAGTDSRAKRLIDCSMNKRLMPIISLRCRDAVPRVAVVADRRDDRAAGLAAAISQREDPELVCIPCARHAMMHGSTEIDHWKIKLGSLGTQ